MPEEILLEKSKFSNSQILSILKLADAGQVVSDLCREHGISSATFYKWQAKYGGMDISMMSRLKELEGFSAKGGEGLPHTNSNGLLAF